MIIEDRQIRHAQKGVRVVEVQFDRFMRYRDGPENVVRVNVRVEVVDLISQSNRTGVQIKSNEGERSLVPTTIGPDKLALVEAHVSLKGELRVARSAPETTDARESYEALEVGNLRGLIDV